MRLLATRDGVFGPIRVFERRSDGARLYCIKSSIQTMTRPDGVSVFGYVHAAQILLRSAKSVLLIGGAGASLATMLARHGHQVTVIDVDPAAEDLARAYFALDERVHWITADPFAFLGARADTFDAVVIDACNAEGLVAPFHDPHVLVALLQRACPDGSLVINLVADDGPPSCGDALARALAARSAIVTLYRSEQGWEGNELLHVRAHGETDVLTVTDIMERPAETRTYLLSQRPFAAVTPPQAWVHFHDRRKSCNHLSPSRR